MSFTRWKREYWLEIKGWSEEVLRLCELAYREGVEERVDEGYQDGYEKGYREGKERGYDVELLRVEEGVRRVIQEHTLFSEEIVQEILAEFKKTIDMREKSNYTLS